MAMEARTAVTGKTSQATTLELKEARCCGFEGKSSSIRRSGIVVAAARVRVLGTIGASYVVPPDILLCVRADSLQRARRSAFASSGKRRLGPVVTRRFWNLDVICTRRQSPASSHPTLKALRMDDRTTGVQQTDVAACLSLSRRVASVKPGPCQGLVNTIPSCPTSYLNVG